jgi:hypothetical protein
LAFHAGELVDLTTTTPPTVRSKKFSTYGKRPVQVTLSNPRKKEDPLKRKEGRRYEEPDEKEREREENKHRRRYIERTTEEVK